MTEELKVDVVEEPVVEVEESVELSPVEVEATEQGWVPLEDWKASGRDEKEWRPAKEFVDRGELYKSIHSTKKELRQTQAALGALQRHHNYVFEKAHEQALRDLRAEKRLAIRTEDFERLEEIEGEIETLQDTHSRERAAVVAQQTAVEAGPSPEFQLFLQRNQWYLTDKDLRDEADAIGLVYVNNGGSREGLAGHVEKKMKERFPAKFGIKPTVRSAPNAVAGVNRQHKANPKVDIQLSDEERAVMKTFVDMGVMSEADYIKELKKVGR